MNNFNQALLSVMLIMVFIVSFISVIVLVENNAFKNNCSTIGEYKVAFSDTTIECNIKENK